MLLAFRFFLCLIFFTYVNLSHKVYGMELPDTEEKPVRTSFSYSQVLQKSKTRLPTASDEEDPSVASETETGENLSYLPTFSTSLSSEVSKSESASSAMESRGLEGKSVKTSFSYSQALKNSTMKVPIVLAEKGPSIASGTGGAVELACVPIFSAPSSSEVAKREDPSSVEYRSSCHYRYKGQLYDNTLFFTKSERIFDLTFLRKLKSKLHHAPTRPDHFPNVCKSFLRVHYMSGRKDKFKMIPMKNIFISGGKYFYRSDFPFQQEYGCVTAVNTVLTQQEKDRFYELDSSSGEETRGLFLQEAINRKLKEFVTEDWEESKGICSEAIFLVHLWQGALFNTIDIIIADEKHPIQIGAIVMGISSYRHCCILCQNLILNFQHNLFKLLTSYCKSSSSKVSLDEKLSSLMIVSGHTQEGDYIGKDQPFLPEDTILSLNEHKLVSVILPSEINKTRLTTVWDDKVNF